MQKKPNELPVIGNLYLVHEVFSLILDDGTVSPQHYICPAVYEGGNSWSEVYDLKLVSGETYEYDSDHILTVNEEMDIPDYYGNMLFHTDNVKIKAEIKGFYPIPKPDSFFAME